jgi:predicted TPR repeat methyltransferase
MSQHQDHKTLLQQADNALLQGDLQLAKKNYEQVDQQGEPAEAVKHNLSLIYLQLGDTAKAIESLKSAVKHFETSEALWKQLGDAYRRNQQFDAAKTAYEHALTIKPSASLHNNLGLLYLNLYDYAQAEHCFKSALALEPDNLSSMFNLALAFKGQKQLLDAVATLMAILAVEKKNSRVFFMLGKILLELNRTKEAETYFHQLASDDPQNPPVFESIINLLLDKGRYLEAKPYCEALLKLCPDNTEIKYNLGVIAEKERKLDIAIEAYHEVLITHSKHFNALNNLAVIYLEKQDLVNARIYFERALALQPYNKSLQYTLGAITGKNAADQAPSEYIANLFDHYAEHFDQHLLEGLDYKVPGLLREAIDACVPEKQQTFDILDLGCGTGLAAVALQSRAKTLTGVDLSSKMVAVAKKKNLFQTLAVDDVVHFLNQTDPTFDLVLAADVLVYVGNLAPLFQALTKRLRSGGLFAFSVEVTDGEQFTLQKTGRFAHSEHYLSQLTKQYHFEVRYSQGAVTRMQNNQPVHGAILVLQKVG